MQFQVALSIAHRFACSRIFLKVGFNRIILWNYVSYSHNILNIKSRRKEIILTAKPALIIQLGIDCVNCCFNMSGWC